MGSACCTPGHHRIQGGNSSPHHTPTRNGRPRSAQLPTSTTTAALLYLQDEFDVDNFISTSTTTPPVTNGHVKREGDQITSCNSLSLTASLPGRKEVDSVRATSVSRSIAKSHHGVPDQTSDDTEYETAYSDFSDRQDEELERTLIQEEDSTLMELVPLYHHQPPRFLLRPKHALCRLGSSVRFVCCVTGRPLPEVSWFASGKAVRPDKCKRFQVTDYSEEDDITDTHALVSILDIVQLRFPDRGEYACVAINSKGQAFCSAFLTVEAEGDGQNIESTQQNGECLANKGATFTPVADGQQVFQVDSTAESPCETVVAATHNAREASPWILGRHPYQVARAVTGSTVTFRCPLQGNPQPRVVRWSKEGVGPVASNGRFNVRMESCDCWLEIENVQMSDGGSYVCTAEADPGSNRDGAIMCVTLLEVEDATMSADEDRTQAEETPLLVITEDIQSSLQSRNSIPSGTPLQRNNSSSEAYRETSERTCRDTTSSSPLSNCQEANFEGRPENMSEERLPEVLEEDLTKCEACEEMTFDATLRRASADGEGAKEETEMSFGITSSTHTPSKGEKSNYASAEDPVSDFTKENLTNNKDLDGGHQYDGRREKVLKRRSSRRNIKSPLTANHSVPGVGSNFGFEEGDLDEKRTLTRTRSGSRKKRTSSRRKKSPNHNSDRVRWDLEKAEELTEKVDSCLDIIDDLLNLTSYDENENETEEKLRHKLDTLMQKFGDSESDIASSRVGTPSHSRRERLKRTDLNLSDSNGEGLEGSEINLNVSKIQTDTNIWGQSLEDSLKVMSDLVGNIKVSVHDGNGDHASITPGRPRTTPKDNVINSNNNNNSPTSSPSEKSLGRHIVKRTPLRELLKHSLFSQDLACSRIRRRPLRVTRSLDSWDALSKECSSNSQIKPKRTHSAGSLFSPSSSRNFRWKSMSLRIRYQQSNSSYSSSSDDEHQNSTSGRHTVGLTSDIAGTEFRDDVFIEQEDKCQQFPDGDLLSPLSPCEASDDSDNHVQELLEDCHQVLQADNDASCLAKGCQDKDGSISGSMSESVVNMVEDSCTHPEPLETNHSEAAVDISNANASSKSNHPNNGEGGEMERNNKITPLAVTVMDNLSDHVESSEVSHFNGSSHDATYVDGFNVSADIGHNASDIKKDSPSDMLASERGLLLI